MSDYPEIIKAAFPPDKARRILEREQQRRGIVGTDRHVKKATAYRPVPAVKPDPVPPVFIHHHDYQKAPTSITRIAGRAVAVTLIGLLGI